MRIVGLALLLATLAVASCASPDPCAGVGGTCLSARVEGSVSGLDSLRVSVAGQPAAMASVPGGTFSLPVRLAIVLPAGATSPALITVDGLTAGSVRASSGPQSVALTPGGKSSFTFQLSQSGGDGDAGIGDGGGFDGPAPGVVSFFPSSLDYGQANRGTMGVTQTITLTNNTTHPVSVINNPNPTGDGESFPIDNSSTCIAFDGGMNQTLSLAAGDSCTLVFSFLPVKSGNLSTSLQATFNDGEMASFTLSGVGLPAWTAENVNPNESPLPNLTAVWGTGAGEYYVTAHDTSGQPPIFHSDASGNWRQWLQGNNNLGPDLLAVTGLDAQHIWLGGPTGLIFMGNGSQSWPAETMAGGFNGAVNGLWAQDSNSVFGVAGKAIIVRSPTGAWTQPAMNAPHVFNAICGAGMRVVAVGGDNPGVSDNAQFFSSDTNNGPIMPVTGVFPGGYQGTLRGCWLPDPNNLWVVGDAGSSIIGLYHCVAPGSSAWTCTHESAGSMTQNLAGIAGRRVPGGSTLDIYAVGALGNVLLHSNGNGNWTTVQVPNNQAMSAVWVGGDGEVMAVGFAGQVNHFH